MGQFQLHENLGKIEFPMGGSVDLHRDKSLSIHLAKQDFAIIQIPFKVKDKSKVVFKLNCRVKKGNACKFLCYSHRSRCNTILGTDLIMLDKTHLRLVLQLHLPLPDDAIIFKIQPKGNKITDLVINEFVIEEIVTDRRLDLVKSVPLFTSQDMQHVIEKERNQEFDEPREPREPRKSRERPKLNPNVRLDGLGLGKTLDRLKNRKIVRARN